MRSAEYTEITAGNEVIDVLRGIGILLMVAGHMHFSALFNHYIFSFHMPLFFTVSGYCYRYPEHFAKSLRSKTKKLLIPYAFFGFAYFLLFSFFK